MKNLLLALAIGAWFSLGADCATAADATWGGGDGDWTDMNWTGGGGTDGAPAPRDTIILPGSNGTLAVTTDLAGGDPFGQLQLGGGVLQVDATGAANFVGARVGSGQGAIAGLNVDGGHLGVDGHMIVGFGVGNGIGGSQGTLNISGAATILVTGNLDTWYDPGAVVSVTGPDADISVQGGFFFVGTRAKLIANINADTHSPITLPAGTAAIQRGQSALDVNFVDGYLPTPGASWTIIDAMDVTGQFIHENLPDLGPGTVLEVNYDAGGSSGRVVTVDFDNVLNLKVDLSTGRATIENPYAAGDDQEIFAYSIFSDSGSLLPPNFTGLSGLGEPGWSPANPTPNALNELNGFQSTTVMTDDSFDIGAIFGAPPVGDATADGRVNIDDLNAVRNNFGAGDGTDLTGIPGDTAPLDGFVNIDDLNNVRNNFGATGVSLGVQDLRFEYGLVDGGTIQGTVEYVTGGASAVPEPSSLVLLLAGAMALPLRRRVA